MGCWWRKAGSARSREKGGGRRKAERKGDGLKRRGEEKKKTNSLQPAVRPLVRSCISCHPLNSSEEDEQYRKKIRLEAKPVGQDKRGGFRGDSRGKGTRVRGAAQGERKEERDGERGGFLCGLDRDELECSNVREMANPHLPFPRARA